jgi:prophage regulatory protein
MLKDPLVREAGVSSPEHRSAAQRRHQDLQPLHAVQIADALLRITTVTQATGLSSATVYRKLAAGMFPEPVRLGSRCTRWKAESIREWIRAQGGAR